MGIPTTDQRNPGAIKPQRYSVAAGLNTNNSDPESQPISFRLLKNCLVDKRLNAVLKKPGSVTESLGSTVGMPLGIFERTTGANDALIPIKRALIANFAGAKWKQQVAGQWSDIDVDDGLSFATSKPSTFAQLGDRVYIAAGLPSYWNGPGTPIKRIGIPAPTLRIGISSFDTGSGITLTQGTSYIYTRYNSLTGLESDWSPPSDPIGAVDNHAILITLTLEVADNWDKIRIYRYLDGGAYPYLVDTIGTAQPEYNDATPDEALTLRAAARYSRAVPVAQSYICANYAQHLWLVDASDPYKLTFSQPYIGVNQDAEYFPTTQNVRASDPITGLLVTSSRMLVFHPRNISVITGTSKDTFRLDPLIPGLGTVFAQSISTNGTDIVFLSEQGLVSVSFGNGNRVHLSREIDLDLQPLLTGSYNAAIYATSCWNPSLRQFIFIISALSTANAQWEEFGTGSSADAVAGWETAAHATDFWEYVSDVVATDVTRIKVWGWSPELSQPTANLWMEYTFPIALDNNSSGAYITCAFHPSPSSDLNDPQQDKTYIGFFTGTAGGVLSAFRRDTSTDSGGTIVSELITGRIAPGNQDGGYKMFHKLGFSGTYTDPTSDSLATLKYLLDFEDPDLRSYAASLLLFTGSSDLKRFTTTEGRYVHLYLTDSSASQSKVLLSEFFIHSRERLRKSKR